MRKLPGNDRNLIRRYLIWCYKTTKESLDRVERYYTQLEVDDFILGILKKAPEHKERNDYKKLVSDFEQYMKTKKMNVDAKKFLDGKGKLLSGDYIYLKRRFLAIEKAIEHFLGQRELKEITGLYEQEMTERILKAREHT